MNVSRRIALALVFLAEAIKIDAKSTNKIIGKERSKKNIDANHSLRMKKKQQINGFIIVFVVSSIIKICTIITYIKLIIIIIEWFLVLDCLIESVIFGFSNCSVIC